MKVLGEVKLEKLVQSLPSGLDTEIGEKGIILSGRKLSRGLSHNL